MGKTPETTLKEKRRKRNDKTVSANIGSRSRKEKYGQRRKQRLLDEVGEARRKVRRFEDEPSRNQKDLKAKNIQNKKRGRRLKHVVRKHTHALTGTR